MGAYQNDPGTVQQEAGFGFNGRFWTESFNNITAKAGGGISGATLVDSMFVSVTVASTNDSVLLPPIAAFPGGALIICVQNISTAAMQVFAQGSDTINGMPGATGVQQMGNSIVYYQCTKAGVWQAIGLGVGFATGLSAAFTTYSTVDGLTAAGTTQANAAAAQQSSIVRYTTVAAGTGALLPAAKAGMDITVCNAGANALLEYAAVGTDVINALSNSTGFSIAAGKSATFYCTSTGQWHTLLSA